MNSTSNSNSRGKQSYVGVIKRVSNPGEIQSATNSKVFDLFLFGMKTNDGKRIMFSLSTQELGWTGDQNKSIVWWWNSKRKREIKTSIKNAERYIGTKIRIEGFLETLDLQKQKFRLKNVQKVVFFLENT